MKEIVSANPTSKDRLVNAARELFLSNGYEATSLSDILEKAEVNAGSLYYHFKTKEELLLAVLDMYMELMWPVLLNPIYERTKDPFERIFGLLDGYRQALVMTGCTYGCPIGSLAMELGDRFPRARVKVAENFANWRDAVRQNLDDAAQRLPKSLDRAQLATFVLTTMEGGVMQSRAQQNLDPFDASVGQLMNYFTLLIAQALEEKTRR